MSAIQTISSVLAHPTAYRLWQSPFAKAKFEPILRHNDLTTIRRVLDVGCGPGTNAALFTEVDYLGLDLNPEYVSQARRRFGDRFRVADVCTYEAEPDNRFDFILMNSLLHHIDTDHVHRILDQLTGQLAAGGHIHILDLEMPASASIARTLARADRGDHARPLDEWQSIFESHFRTEVFEPYPIALGGVTLWNMVYFKGSV